MSRGRLHDTGRTARVGIEFLQINSGQTVRTVPFENLDRMMVA
jgi:hypothetical protein